MKMSNFELAIDDYKALLEIKPNNTVAQEQIKVARRELANMKQREKSMYHNMFDKVRRSPIRSKRDRWVQWSSW